MIPRDIFEKKKILVCCGSGGVGKTTAAAAIALEAAMRGKKAIVLTIDPARRLATAMGLSELSSEPVEIDLGALASGGRSPSAASGEITDAQMGGVGWRAGSPPTAKSRPSAEGRLFAMMLDTKRTFDRLIEKYTSNPERRAAIFKNRLYQHMSNMIAGSQEYMAMEKLYEISQGGGFDLMVLDTPPTRHALDFLEAPQKMRNITGNSLLRWFLKPGLFASRIGLGAVQKGVEKIFSVLDRLAGFSFLHELSQMISLLGNLLGGFHDRAEAVDELLRKKMAGFILVTNPSSVSIQDALFFHQKIKESRLPFVGFVINRIHEAVPEIDEGELSPLPVGLQPKVLYHLENYRHLAQRDQKAVALLKKMGGKNAAYATVPLFAGDVHDLGGLAKMNQALFT